MKLDDPMSMKRLGGRTPRMRVSLSPSKIPYVGFSPVRLQTRRRVRPSSEDLYAPQADGPDLYGRERHGRRDQSQRHPRPEALGSPRGYVVPSGCRLLWPPPNLSRPPVDLWIRRQVLATAGRERVPNLLCV